MCQFSSIQCISPRGFEGLQMICCAPFLLFWTRFFLQEMMACLPRPLSQQSHLEYQILCLPYDIINSVLTVNDICLALCHICFQSTARLRTLEFQWRKDEKGAFIVVMPLKDKSNDKVLSAQISAASMIRTVLGENSLKTFGKYWCNVGHLSLEEKLRAPVQPSWTSPRY